MATPECCESGTTRGPFLPDTASGSRFFTRARILHLINCPALLIALALAARLACGVNQVYAPIEIRSFTVKPQFPTLPRTLAFRRCGQKTTPSVADAFTLIELLVVIA